MATRKPTPNQKFDWKNHPVVIASGSAAAAFFFAIALFTQVVLPTQTAKLDAGLSKYKEAKEKAEIASKSLEGIVSSLEVEIKNLKSEKSLTEQQLEESRAGNIFSPGNPYPNGLAAVKIGAQRDAIEKEYSSQSKEIDKEDPEIVRVYLKNSPFETVSFFMTNKTPKAKVSHVSFDLPLFDSKYSEDFLFKKINENFGQPITDSSDKNYMWAVGSKYSIFAYNNTGYVLMSRGMAPVFWRVSLVPWGALLCSSISPQPNLSFERDWLRQPLNLTLNFRFGEFLMPATCRKRQFAFPESSRLTRSRSHTTDNWRGG